LAKGTSKWSIAESAAKFNSRKTWEEKRRGGKRSRNNCKQDKGGEAS